MARFFAALFLVSVLTVSAYSQERLPRDNSYRKFHEAPRYRESESHPLRIISYLLHPIGWAAREGIFKPMSYFVSSTPKRKSVFGFREPYDTRRPMCYNGENVFPECKAIGENIPQN